MKIECPQCGQHYEVDSSMLDRHFRCTECKTFFLGLNAKTVRDVKYKRVERSEDAVGETDGTAVETVANSGGNGEDAAELTVPKAVPVKAVTADGSRDEKLAAAFPEEEMPVYNRSAFKAGSLEKIGIGAALLMCVFLIILLLVCNSRLNDMSERVRAIRSENTALQGKIEQQERRAVLLDARVAAADDKFAQIERWHGEISTRLQDDSLQKQLNSQNEMLRKFEVRLADHAAAGKELEKRVNSLVEARRQTTAGNSKKTEPSGEDEYSTSGERRYIRR